MDIKENENGFAKKISCNEPSCKEKIIAICLTPLALERLQENLQQTEIKEPVCLPCNNDIDEESLSINIHVLDEKTHIELR